MLDIDGKKVETNENGYLINPADWDEKIAHAMAKEEDIELTQKHLDVIAYLRNEFFNNNENQPNTRNIVKAMQTQWGDKSISARDLYGLFPKDPSKQGGRFAGLPESRRKGGY